MSRVRQKDSVAVEEGEVRKQSRPKECPRLLTLPVEEGKGDRLGECPKNYKAIKSKSGKSTCCKKKQLIPLRKGTLRKHGYSTDLSKAKRHAALKKAVKAENWLKVFRKLNAVAIYNKNRPKLHKIFIADRDWVKREFA
jgi:hypothetical protein